MGRSGQRRHMALHGGRHGVHARRVVGVVIEHVRDPREHEGGGEVEGVVRISRSCGQVEHGALSEEVDAAITELDFLHVRPERPVGESGA